jgi:hypothetical protein
VQQCRCVNASAAIFAVRQCRRSNAGAAILTRADHRAGRGQTAGQGAGRARGRSPGRAGQGAGQTAGQGAGRARGRRPGRAGRGADHRAAQKQKGAGIPRALLLLCCPPALKLGVPISAPRAGIRMPYTRYQPGG